ncbi:MAG: helix-turn-helix domain-containing protein [Niastella sp.]|nr:helix-turn-helix domain-containing protein [Niastella sp.]
MNTTLREITPLTQSDCFTLFSRKKKNFDFPLHHHEEYELNLILNAKGAKRIVGDHVSLISDAELVFVGPNLDHGWFDCELTGKEIQEVTIQFNKDLLSDSLLKKNQLNFINHMFERSRQGILFSQEVIKRLQGRILGLVSKTGFDSVLELFSILHDLSTSRNMVILSGTLQHKEVFNYNSRRIEKAYEYMNKNYQNQLTLSEVAKVINMPEASFSRFIKKRTGKTFTDSLNDIRLGHATRMLINTTDTIAEVAFKCGFNNMSNFNRIFKRRKNTTPKGFRENYSGTRIFI